MATAVNTRCQHAVVAVRVHVTEVADIKGEAGFVVAAAVSVFDDSVQLTAASVLLSFGGRCETTKNILEFKFILFFKIYLFYNSFANFIYLINFK